MAYDFDQDTVPARTRGKMAPGEAVKLLRELRGWSQARLAKESGIPQPVLSAIENKQTSVGIERSKKLAKALGVHPAIIAFADVPESRSRK